jgi:hypothetical protein
MNTDLSTESRFRAAVDTLDAQGFDTAEIRREKAAREVRTIRTPNASDLAFPLNTPASWLPHFVNGQPPVLTNSTLRVGARLQLSPGQRSTLRERYELTPTKVVEVVNIELFEGTKMIRELVLRSDLHVSEHQRKHILVHCRISDFGAWYGSSVELDREREAEASPRTVGARQEKSPKAFELTAGQLAEMYL